MKKYEQYNINILNELISYNSVNPPGNELPLASHILTTLDNIGLRSKLIKCSETRGSIISVIGNPIGKKLIFNGHLDVVPAHGNWKTDPFKAHIYNNRVYGRGTSDMKGAIACMITAVKKLIDDKFDFKNGQLILAFVADEEMHNKGTLSILNIEEMKKADYVIIGEPTSLNLNIAHRGTARFLIKVMGKSCHSSIPTNGINAINKMKKVLEAICEYDIELSKRSHDILPSPNISTVMINGGERDNIIPNLCEIRVDRRTIPFDTSESIFIELHKILEDIKSTDSEFNYVLEPYLYLGAGEIHKNSELVKIVTSVYKDCFNVRPDILDFKATCEQTLFINQGIQTIIIGPGSIEQAHTIDEYIDIGQLNDAVFLYENIIKRILG